MVNLRENLVWFVVLLGIVISTGLSWYFSSEIFLNLVSVLVGFLASYLLLVRQQERAWKREYSIKIAETVYGSLYRAVKGIVSSLEERLLRPIYFLTWREFQQDHKYFMVQEKFRAELDEFLKYVQNYEKQVIRLRNTILPKILHKEANRIFKTETKEIALRIKHESEGEVFLVPMTEDRLVEHLISEIHPKDYSLKRYPESKVVDFQILFEQVYAGSDVVDKFDKFWESCLRDMKEDKTYMRAIEENDKLLEEAKRVKKEIAKRIEEPWKI